MCLYGSDTVRPVGPIQSRVQAGHIAERLIGLLARLKILSSASSRTSAKARASDRNALSSESAIACREALAIYNGIRNRSTRFIVVTFVLFVCEFLTQQGFSIQ